MVMLWIRAAVRAKTNWKIPYKLHFRSCLFKTFAILSQTECKPAQAWESSVALRQITTTWVRRDSDEWGSLARAYLFWV